MRILTLAILAICGSIHAAEAPQFERTWAFFLIVTDQEQQAAGQGRALLAGIGLSDEGAAALLQHMQQSVESVRVLERDMERELCTNREGLQDPYVLANRLQDNSERQAAARRAATENLSATIKPGDSETFLRYLNEKTRFTLSQDAEVHDAVRMGSISTDKVFAHACEGSAS